MTTIRIFLILCLVIPASLLANNDTGIANELFLKFGKSIRVGAPYSASIKTLESQSFACLDNRIGYDQVVVCRANFPDQETSQSIAAKNPAELSNDNYTWIVNIVIGVEGEIVKDYDVQISSEF